MKIYLGLDIGTTSAKVCAFSQSGVLVKEWVNSYPLLSPTPGAAVQEVEVVFNAIFKGLKAAARAFSTEIVAVSISAAMHSVILLDKDDQPLTPIITWADTRAQLDQFSEEKRLALLRTSGTPVHPMSPFAKLVYLAWEHPRLWSQTSRVSDLKSLLVHRLSQDGFLLDSNLASATGLLNLNSLSWDQNILDIVGVEREHMPVVVAPTTQLSWRTTVANDLGIRPDVPLFIGGSDGCLANLGSNILGTNEVAMSVGTSGALRTTHTKSEIDPKLGLFNYHLLGPYYVMGGATNNGAKLLEWGFEMFRGQFKSIEEMLSAAAAVSCDGLTFTPYLYGERAPIYDALASASFTGMRAHHQPAQYVRAVVEGITDNLLHILENLEAAGQRPDRILASGGFTKSKWWLQLFAERSGGRSFELAQTTQASAYGAVLMARIGLGELELPTPT